MKKQLLKEENQSLLLAVEILKFKLKEKELKVKELEFQLKLKGNCL